MTFAAKRTTKYSLLASLNALEKRNFGRVGRFVNIIQLCTYFRHTNGYRKFKMVNNDPNSNLIIMSGNGDDVVVISGNNVIRCKHYYGAYSYHKMGKLMLTTDERKNSIAVSAKINCEKSFCAAVLLCVGNIRILGKNIYGIKGITQFKKVLISWNDNFSDNIVKTLSCGEIDASVYVVGAKALKRPNGMFVTFSNPIINGDKLLFYNGNTNDYFLQDFKCPDYMTKWRLAGADMINLDDNNRKYLIYRGNQSCVINVSNEWPPKIDYNWLPRQSILGIFFYDNWDKAGTPLLAYHSSCKVQNKLIILGGFTVGYNELGDVKYFRKCKKMNEILINHDLIEINLNNGNLSKSIKKYLPLRLESWHGTRGSSLVLFNNGKLHFFQGNVHKWIAFDDLNAFPTANDKWLVGLVDYYFKQHFPSSSPIAYDIINIIGTYIGYIL